MAQVAQVAQVAQLSVAKETNWVDFFHFFLGHGMSLAFVDFVPSLVAQGVF